MKEAERLSAIIYQKAITTVKVSMPTQLMTSQKAGATASIAKEGTWKD